MGFGARTSFFSLDSKSLATYAHDEYRGGKRFQWVLWDAANGKQRAVLWDGGLLASPSKLSFSPSSPRVSVMNSEGALHTWDVLTGKELTARKALGARAIAYSPNGNLLFFDGLDVRDADTGLRSYVLSRESYEQFGSYHPDLLMGNDDESFKVWHLGTGERRGQFHVQFHGNSDLTPDGWFYAGMAGDSVTCFVWNGRTGQSKPFPPADGAAGLALSCGGRFLAACTIIENQEPAWLTWLREQLGASVSPSGDGVLIFALDSQAQVGALEGALFARFAPDGRTLAVAYADGKVPLYDFPLRKPYVKITLYALLAASLLFFVQRGLAWLRRRRPVTPSIPHPVIPSS